MTVTARDARYLALTLALTTLFVGAWSLSEALMTPPREPAPALTAQTTTGATFTLAEARGQVVVLDFFATWCQPCKVAEASIRTVRDEGAPDRFLVVSVGADEAEDLATLAAYATNESIPWTVAKVEAGVVEAYGVTVFAYIVVIDAEGRIAARLTGSPTPDDVRRAVEEAGA